MMDVLHSEIFWIVILTIYAIGVTISTKFVYKWMIDIGLDKNVAIYFDRKLVHIFAGGIVLLIVPFVFTSPISPLITGFILTAFTLFYTASI